MTPASLKELKEIWNQYMRTPLSGSGQHPPHTSITQMGAQNVGVGLHESQACRVSSAYRRMG
ncbi:hypothetical protein BGW80DRAFT_1347129 [Lactifluus volemus]|nr:hypothetical protein BGW80DRAFT_1347129 [Lactifluus volemus]